MKNNSHVYYSLGVNRAFDSYTLIYIFGGANFGIGKDKPL